MPVGGPLDRPDLRRQVGLHLVHRPADTGIDLDIALHEFGLDRILQCRRQVGQDLPDGAPEGHRSGVHQLELNLHAQGGPGVAAESGLGHVAGLFRGPWPIGAPSGRPGSHGVRAIVLGPAASHAAGHDNR